MQERNTPSKDDVKLKVELCRVDFLLCALPLPDFHFLTGCCSARGYNNMVFLIIGRYNQTTERKLVFTKELVEERR
jgi:hypothetical protein